MSVGKKLDGLTYKEVQDEILEIEQASRERLKYLRALAKVLQNEEGEAPSSGGEAPSSGGEAPSSGVEVPSSGGEVPSSE